MTWSITPLPLFEFSVPGPEVFFQRGFEETVNMVIYAFLLRRGSDAILVDSGLIDDFGPLNEAIRARKGRSAGFLPCSSHLFGQLSWLGVMPTRIIATSFGPYAVGGVHHFPDAELIVSQRGLADLLDPEEPALCHPLPPTIADRLQNATTLRGAENVVAGVQFVETGIHHPASAAVVVDTANGKIAIADPVFVARNLTEGLALGAAENAAQWHAMVRRLGQMADAIIPIHDVDPTPVPKVAWHRSLSGRN